MVVGGSLWIYFAREFEFFPWFFGACILLLFIQRLWYMHRKVFECFHLGHLMDSYKSNFYCFFHVCTPHISLDLAKWLLKNGNILSWLLTSLKLSYKSIETSLFILLLYTINWPRLNHMPFVQGMSTFGNLL